MKIVILVTMLRQIFVKGRAQHIAGTTFHVHASICLCGDQKLKEVLHSFTAQLGKYGSGNSEKSFMVCTKLITVSFCKL